MCLACSRSSASAQFNYPFIAAYGGSKWAMRGITGPQLSFRTACEFTLAKLLKPVAERKSVYSVIAAFRTLAASC